MFNTLCFDLETQLSADEVGGWGNAHDMRMSIGCTKKNGDSMIRTFTESHVEDLINELNNAELVIGFNIKGFDYKVLSRYTNLVFTNLPTFDLLNQIHLTLGHRVSLDNLAQPTLGIPKSADGLQAIQWFKEGEYEKIMQYCRRDVEITEQLFNVALRDGHLQFIDRYGNNIKRVDTSHWKKVCENILNGNSISS